MIFKIGDYNIKALVYDMYTYTGDKDTDLYMIVINQDTAKTAALKIEKHMNSNGNYIDIPILACNGLHFIVEKVEEAIILMEVFNGIAVYGSEFENTLDETIKTITESFKF